MVCKDMDELEREIKRRIALAANNEVRAEVDKILSRNATSVARIDRLADTSKYKSSYNASLMRLTVWSTARPDKSIFGQKIRSNRDTLFTEWVNNGEWFDLSKWFKDGMPSKEERDNDDYRMPARRFIHAAQKEIDRSDAIIKAIEKYF